MKHFILYFIFFNVFFSAISQKNDSTGVFRRKVIKFISSIIQKNDSIDEFRLNKFSFYFIYNRPLFNFYDVIYKPENADPQIEKIRTKMFFYPDRGFRLNYSFRFYQRNKFYHFFRMNFKFHRQYIEFKDTVYVNNSSKKYYNEYFADILNLSFLPEYNLRFKINRSIALQAGTAYNYSYTFHTNFEFFKLLFPFWLNKNYFINNYQINITVLVHVTKNILLEQGFYWNTNPFWNKYIGFMLGVNL